MLAHEAGGGSRQAVRPRGRVLHTRTSGQLGHTHSAAPPAPSATIPTRYETSLFRQPAEREGFGSQARRFGDGSASDTPGPGTYTDPNSSSVLRDAPSIGKRGYGVGFASRTVRTGLVSALRARGLPGPGSYDMQAYRGIGTEARAVCRPFQQPKGGRVLRPDDAADENEQPPSPRRDDARRADGGGGHRSAFAGMAPRFARASAQTAGPGPGRYDVAAPQLASDVPSAAFRPASVRPPQSSASGRRPPALGELLGEPRARTAQRGVSAGSQRPSPSARAVAPSAAFRVGFTVRRHAAAAPRARALRGAPMRLSLGSAALLRGRAADPARLFYARPPRAQDRFGRPRERLSKDTAVQPGPGAYDVLGAPDRQGKHTFGAREEAAPLPSATFLSATGQERHAGGGAPLRRCPCLACAALRSAPLPLPGVLLQR